MSRNLFLRIFILFLFTLENGSTDPLSNSKLHINKNVFNSFEERIAIKDKTKKWLDHMIPYIISDEFSYLEKSLIENAINNYNKTCVKFLPKNFDDNDYIVIAPGIGCNSQVGRQGGAQNVTLGRGCLYFNTIVHELMHSIGFYHEHQRPDRDLFLIIHMENIKRGMEYEFKKLDSSETTDQDFDYDYNSVMQYEETAFSRNGRPTMEPRLKTIKLGPINGLSDTDVLRINRYYECDRNENVYTIDRNFKCRDLKWKAFDLSKISDLFVFGGTDSYGNRFYVCRTSIGNRTLAGHMFRGMCHVAHQGLEVALKNFDVLTHSSNHYKWYFTDHSLLILANAVIIGLRDEKQMIGKCIIKSNDFESEVIGTIEVIDSIWVLNIAFNGLRIKCNEFKVLMCLK